jgi:hypothetical protein
MEEGIKRLRVKIDGLAQLTKELKPIKTFENTHEHFLDFVMFGESVHKEIRFNSKEIDKAVDSLYLAKAWLGKVLGELGADNPYKSGYKTKEDIEPTADTANLDKESKLFYNSDNSVLRDAVLTEDDWNKKNHIEKVDWLRTEISFISSYETGSIFYFNEEMYPNANRYFNNYMDYMSEARFWLGFELERIKNN